MEENDRLIKGRLLCAAAAERNPYVIIDAGARGNLPEPWSLMAPDNVRVHGFEPDPEAYRELEKLHTLNRLYHPFALWNKQGAIQLHLNMSRATSSVYPPNPEVLEVFSQKNTASRAIEKIIEVPANSLDEMIEEKWIDHLKIDVHSAEMEVLEGAAKLLSSVFSVLVEAWCLEVHKGQRLLGDILVYMDQKGFEPYTFDNQYMAWDEAKPAGLKTSGRKRQVASVVLFIRKDFKRIPDNQKFKAAAILDIYGYPEAAHRMLKLAKVDSETLENHLSTWNNRPKLRGPILRRILGQKEDLYIAPLT
jgi:FkbM family methyltransferase